MMFNRLRAFFSAENREIRRCEQTMRLLERNAAMDRALIGKMVAMGDHRASTVQKQVEEALHRVTELAERRDKLIAERER
jgi:hypothetical protein